MSNYNKIQTELKVDNNGFSIHAVVLLIFNNSIAEADNASTADNGSKPLTSFISSQTFRLNRHPSTVLSRNPLQLATITTGTTILSE